MSSLFVGGPLGCPVSLFQGGGNSGGNKFSPISGY
jgi:hypothetical protein